MRICPGCRRTFKDSDNFCPHEGLPLIDKSETFSAIDPGQDEDPLSRPEDAALEPGMMVNNYQVEGVVAEGGIGVVYAGIHPLIRKRVAIKVINSRYARDTDAVSRFVLEARSVNEIGHHNIIDIFSIGELDDGRNYLIMELLDGLSLQELLKQEERLEPGAVLSIYEQLCDALDVAHDKGFVHRDLKPDNILVLRRPPHPYIKILDFGLAKLRGGAVDHDTKVGTVMGTPEYMAPEQCRGAQVDGRSDIYALGVILYELLTGHKPFSSSSIITVLNMQQLDPPPPPSSHCPVSPDLEKVILRALAKEPRRRFSTPGDLLLQLKRTIPAVAGWTIDLGGAPRPPSEVPHPAPDEPASKDREEAATREMMPAQMFEAAGYAIDDVAPESSGAGETAPEEETSPDKLQFLSMFDDGLARKSGDDEEEEADLQTSKTDNPFEEEEATLADDPLKRFGS